MKKIRIVTDEVEMDALLNDSVTAEKIYSALPISAAVNTWGDEIYFEIPVKSELENGVETVEKGDIGYWPPGKAFCIFFGRTPASTADEIKPASAVCVVGKLTGNPEEWKKVKDGKEIILNK